MHIAFDSFLSQPAISWLPFSWYREAPGTSPAKLLATKVLADTLFFQAPFVRTGWSRSGDLIGDLSPLGCPRPLAFCSLALAFAAAANPAVSPDRHPPAQLTLYFGVMGLLEGLSFEKTFEKTKESFHQAWALSLLVWTPVQCVNLFYVPAAWQPFVVSAVNVGWKSTLSLLNQYHGGGDRPGGTSSTPWNAEDLEREMADLRVEMMGMRAQLTFLQAENDALRSRRKWWWPF